MTCDHVLGLIDARPFADYSPAQLDAAWAHARECATCGPALRLGSALSNDLATLPQPEPPQHLAPAVLARIARLPEAPASPRTIAAAPAGVRSGWQDHAAAAAGVIAAGVIAHSIALGEGPAIDLTSPRIGETTGLLGLEATARWWTTLAVSLVLYVTGLFLPVRTVGRRAR